MLYSSFHIQHWDLDLKVHMYHYQRLGFAPTISIFKGRLIINATCGRLVIYELQVKYLFQMVHFLVFFGIMRYENLKRTLGLELSHLDGDNSPLFCYYILTENTWTIEVSCGTSLLQGLKNYTIGVVIHLLDVDKRIAKVH